MHDFLLFFGNVFTSFVTLCTTKWFWEFKVYIVAQPRLFTVTCISTLFLGCVLVKICQFLEWLLLLFFLFFKKGLSTNYAFGELLAVQQHLDNFVQSILLCLWKQKCLASNGSISACRDLGWNQRQQWARIKILEEALHLKWPPHCQKCCETQRLWVTYITNILILLFLQRERLTATSNTGSSTSPIAVPIPSAVDYSFGAM